MKNFIVVLFVAVISFVSGFFIKNFLSEEEFLITNNIQLPQEKPLEKYQIENLSNETVPAGEFNLIEQKNDLENFNQAIFSFEFQPALSGSIKQTTGSLNAPKDEGRYPLVVMIRGYVDQSLYLTGMGTSRAGEYFAENGFVTIAPDFLGYADSDPEAGNIFETRFQTYTTTLSLLESLDNDSFNQIAEGKWDGQNIFLWGHSNGGHISLTVLEVTGEDYPTTLWAPVSKPFPYSILYYTDDSEDKGKFIRKKLAEFEELYDVEKYSLDNYFNRINTSVQIHQGTADTAVPHRWSDQLVSSLEENDIDVTYYKYPGADHNLRPDWDTVVERDLEFFQENIKKVD